MNSYHLRALSDISVQKKLEEPVSQQSKEWVLLIHDTDPATGLVTIKIATFLDNRLDLKIVPKSVTGNGYHELQIEDSEPTVDYRYQSAITSDDPKYTFGTNKGGKPVLVVGGVDIVAYLEGVSNEFDLEHSQLGIKVIEDTTNSTFMHKISYAEHQTT